MAPTIPWSSFKTLILSVSTGCLVEPTVAKSSSLWHSPTNNNWCEMLCRKRRNTEHFTHQRYDFVKVKCARLKTVGLPLQLLVIARTSQIFAEKNPQLHDWVWAHSNNFISTQATPWSWSGMEPCDAIDRMTHACTNWSLLLKNIYDCTELILGLVFNLSLSWQLELQRRQLAQNAPHLDLWIICLGHRRCLLHFEILWACRQLLWVVCWQMCWARPPHNCWLSLSYP